MIRKFIFVALLAVIVSLPFISCSIETEPDRELEGTWHFTTTPDLSTDDPGAFSADQTYLAEFEFFVTIEVYSGFATIGGEVYTCSSSFVPSTNDVTFSFTQDADADGDSIEFVGTLSGGTITGDYDGLGAYNGGVKGTYHGTFTATK